MGKLWSQSKITLENFPDSVYLLVNLCNHFAVCWYLPAALAEKRKLCSPKQNKNECNCSHYNYRHWLVVVFERLRLLVLSSCKLVAGLVRCGSSEDYGLKCE